MIERLQDRHLTVYAQDEKRKPLTGAVFAFSVAGADYGTLESSAGRASITLPGTETRPVTVTASFEGQSTTAKLPPDQQTYTFTFRSASSMASKISRPIFWTVAFLGTIIAAAIALLVSVHPRLVASPLPPPDPDERRAQAIARACAGGGVVVNESSLNAELTTAVKRAKAGAAVTTQDVGAIVSKIPPDQTGLAFYQAYTKCIADNLASLRANPQTLTPVPGDTGGAASIGAAQGWSYYEEENGKPTKDGVLMPARSQPAPSYAKVSRGLVLKARRGFKVRKEPDGSSEILSQPGAARCVVVLTDPTHPVQVSEATSGGWLEIAPTRCPSEGQS